MVMRKIRVPIQGMDFRMATTYFGLGGNIGDRFAYLQDAIRGLADFCVIEATSRVYETAPVHVTDQPRFLNMAVRARTDLAPRTLLTHIQGVENRLGRVRNLRWGPRVIDIDILLYADRIVDEADLTVPHPRMAERRFVLAPLADIAAAAILPSTDRTVSDLLAALPPDDDILMMAESVWDVERGEAPKAALSG